METFSPGLAGVIAYRTEISEPNRDGGFLRYRGVDTFRLAGAVSYDAVWGLLVRGHLERPLPLSDHFEAIPFRSGDVRSDVQAAVAALAGARNLKPLVDLSQEEAISDLETVTNSALSYIAQAGRGEAPAVPHDRVSEGRSAVERFMIEWRGDPDPAHVEAIESYWITAAEHGANASTFTARVIASTGADASAAISGAIGSLSGPLHGGAPSRALHLIDAVDRDGDAVSHVREVLDSGGRLMGFGHPVYRAEDPRARIMRATAERLGVPKYDAALAVEQAALSLLKERKPDRVLSTNVDYWAAVILDFVGVPEEMLTPLFACARLGGWSAHIAEQKLSPKIFRPSASYEGISSADPEQLPGWSDRRAEYVGRARNAA